MAKFSATVKTWGDKVLKEFEDIRRVVILELFVSVILDTPVDSGRSRGNWQVSIGSSESGIVDISGTSYDGESKSGKEWQSPRGPVSIKKRIEVEKVALEGKIGVDQAVYLTNNLPYTYKLEYGGYNGPTGKVTGDGFSRKSPEGMVRRNFIRVSQNLKRKHG